MCEENKIDRRDMLKLLTAVGLGGVTAAPLPAPGAMLPGQGWVESKGARPVRATVPRCSSSPRRSRIEPPGQ